MQSELETKTKKVIVQNQCVCVFIWFYSEFGEGIFKYLLVTFNHLPCTIT